MAIEEKLMKHFIGYQSALEYWRRCRHLPESSADRRCRVSLPDGSSRMEAPDYSGFELPVHIMIGERCARHESKMVILHLFSKKTPVGCFMNNGNGLMVSSPEFCFLQMADRLTLVGLIELGYELCSVYSIPPKGDSSLPKNGFYNREPLTSVNKLKGFLEIMPGVKGHKKAKHALRYMLDGAASPMETKLAMFLVLPYMLGGFGFDLPELNKRIDLTKAARKDFDKDYLVCDMFWSDKKIAVEYDSDQQHTGPDRIASDSKRRTALDLSGIRVVSVTKQQLYSTAELERVARTIANHMNRRLLLKRSKFYTAHRELRKMLFPKSSLKQRHI